MQPKSIYRAVKRKLKSGENKVNLADVALANNYLSGDLNLKCEMSDPSGALHALPQAKGSNFSNSVSGLVPRSLDES